LEPSTRAHSRSTSAATRCGNARSKIAVPVRGNPLPDPVARFASNTFTAFAIDRGGLVGKGELLRGLTSSHDGSSAPSGAERITGCTIACASTGAIRNPPPRQTRSKRAGSSHWSRALSKTSTTHVRSAAASIRGTPGPSPTPTSSRSGKRAELRRRSCRWLLYSKSRENCSRRLGGFLRLRSSRGNVIERAMDDLGALPYSRFAAEICFRDRDEASTRTLVSSSRAESDQAPLPTRPTTGAVSQADCCRYCREDPMLRISNSIAHMHCPRLVRTPLLNACELKSTNQARHSSFQSRWGTAAVATKSNSGRREYFVDDVRAAPPSDPCARKFRREEIDQDQCIDWLRRDRHQLRPGPASPPAHV